MTADGKIATANRAISSFGSARDHEHLLELRATADAVMAGARTMDLNSINLGPGPLKFRRSRLRRGLTEYNLRIIVSGSGSINPQAEIFKPRFADANKPLNRPSDSLSMNRSAEHRLGQFLNSSKRAEAVLGTPIARFMARMRVQCWRRKLLMNLVAADVTPRHICFGEVSKSPIIILTTERASASALRRLRRLADDVKVCGKTEINFRAALRWLRSRWDVKRLLCEGGGELNDALFRARLVDELHLTVCPKIFGGRTAPTIADGLGIAKLANAAPLKLKSARQVGDEMFLVLERA